MTDLEKYEHLKSDSNIGLPELKTLDYRPSIRVNKADNQPTEQYKTDDRTCVTKITGQEIPREQPNQELIIVKTIQGLTSVINNELSKLNKLTKFLSCNRNSLVLQALEDIDIFQRTTLNELQKAFE